ncbi:MAG: glycosyl transferase, partial [Agathobacter sp.]|nr:glycosyl transferase [Agathobacter sp.]
FAGFTPYYTCVVWGGYDDNAKQNGSNCVYSRNIWREVMGRIHTNLPYKEFEQPSEITTVMVCKDSGFLPLPGICEFAAKGNSVYAEFFTKGTEPVTTCNHHAVVNVCQATGMMASGMCPYAFPVIYITGADPMTEDAPFIASEQFLASPCPHWGW